MLSLCAALMMLAACCLLAPGTDRDSAAPAPLVFRWRKGWLPLGLTLLFACRAYGPAVGVVTWFGLLAPAGVLTALFMGLRARGRAGLAQEPRAGPELSSVLSRRAGGFPVAVFRPAHFPRGAKNLRIVHDCP